MLRSFERASRQTHQTWRTNNERSQFKRRLETGQRQLVLSPARRELPRHADPKHSQQLGARRASLSEVIQELESDETTTRTSRSERPL